MALLRHAETHGQGPLSGEIGLNADIGIGGGFDPEPTCAIESLQRKLAVLRPISLVANCCSDGLS
jgi:hypothetical protein